MIKCIAKHIHKSTVYSQIIEKFAQPSEKKRNKMDKENKLKCVSEINQVSLTKNASKSGFM